MKRARCLLLALFALASAAAAQTETPSDGLWDDWTNSSADWDELAIAVDMLALTVGSSKPWPAPDPVFATPAAWREAVRGAPAVTAREILASTEGLRVQLRWTQSARELMSAGSGEVYRDIAEALRKNGHGADPDATPTLDLVLDLQTAAVRVSRSGKPYGSELVACLVAEAGLIVPARVLRSGEVQHAMCSVANETRMIVIAGEPTRADVARGLDEAVTGLLQGSAGGAGAVPTSASPWSTWLAGDSESLTAERQAAFAASYRSTEDDLDPGLGAIIGFRELRAQYRGRDEIPASFRFSDHRLVGGWAQRLSASGFSFGLEQGPVLVNDVHMGKNTATKDVLYFPACYSRVADPNAELVARYLRTRKLADVPEETLFEIANRIAIALRPIQNDWILGVDEQRQVYLPYVGDERARSEHFERMVDWLVLADPLGMWAFDSIWNHDKSSGGYRPVLPDGFVERLTGPRPSGPGALRGVWVLEPAEIVHRKIIFLGDIQRASQIRASFQELAPRLEGHRMLFCEYIPADGNMNLTLSRYFWYESEPEGWSELKDEFPDELSFSQIGPPLPRAPDYIEDANYANGQRR